MKLKVLRWATVGGGNDMGRTQDDCTHPPESGSR
jgi:hypothetical protein